MNGKGPRKKKAKKKGAKKAPPSGLLARLFRKDAGDGKAKDKGGKAGKAGAAAAKARPLTPLERSIQEIKHMTKVGQSDPERLAMMLSKLLQQEKQKHDRAQEDFDAMVWDIVHKAEAGDGDGEDTSDDAPEAPDADPPDTDGPEPHRD